MDSAVNSTKRRKRAWLRYSLRSLLILTTVVAAVLGLYDPLNLHFKSVHFLNVTSDAYSTRTGADEQFVNIQGADDAVLCYVGEVRFVLLGRTLLSSSSLHVPVAGERPSQGVYRSVQGKPYFSYEYAHGMTNCVVHGFEFICRKGSVQIDGQTLDTGTPTVVLVDSEGAILKIYSP